MAIGAALGIGAAAGGLGSILSGRAQGRAAKRGREALQRSFEESERQLAPWRQIGQDALQGIRSTLGLPGPDGVMPDGRDFSQFFASPGYQFRLDQGTRAIEQSAAGSGLLQSGRTGKALQRFGQGLASSEYNNYLNSLFQTAGIGERATQATEQLRTGAAGGQASLFGQQGAARASQFSGLANAAVGGLSGYAGLLGYGQQSNASIPSYTFQPQANLNTNFGF